MTLILTKSPHTLLSFNVFILDFFILKFTCNLYKDLAKNKGMNNLIHDKINSNTGL